METRAFGRYDYTDLLARATGPNAEQIDLNTLGAWFEQYGHDYWNGEYYDADGHRLFPIMVYDFSTDECEVEGYEFR